MKTGVAQELWLEELEHGGVGLGDVREVTVGR
jgi:hypothetical protein